MYKHKVLIPEDIIQERIATVAASLNRDYVDRALDVICILKGSLIFTSDLIRKLTMPVRLHFVQVSSYGDENESSGTVNLHFSSVSEDLTGRDVLLVEDVLGYWHYARLFDQTIKGRTAGDIEDVCPT